MSNKTDIIWICFLTQIGLLITGAALSYWIDYDEKLDIFVPLTIFSFITLPHLLLSKTFGSVSIGTLSLFLMLYLPIGLCVLGFTALIVHEALLSLDKIKKSTGTKFFYSGLFLTRGPLILGSAAMFAGVLGLNSSGTLPGQPIHLWGNDTLFHATIAELFKNYGVGTIGLTDLRPISYHTFSHELFARLSEFSGVPITTLYPWIPVAVFGPILLSVATEFACIYATSKRNVVYFILLIVIAFSLIRLLMLIGLPAFDSFLASESFVIGLIALVSAHNIISNIDIAERWWTMSTKALVAVFGIVVCVASKVSLFFAALALLTYLSIQITTWPKTNLNRFCRITLMFITLFAAALVLLSVFAVATKVAKPPTFESFYLVRKYGSLPFQESPNELVSTISMGLGVSMLFLPIFFYFTKSGFFKRAGQLVAQKFSLQAFTPLDLIMMSALPSFIIGVFMPNYGGSGAYFVLPFLLLSLLYALARITQNATVIIAVLLSWNLISENSWASAFVSRTIYVKPFPSTDIEIEYIKKLNAMDHYEKNSDPIDFSILRPDAEKIWNCRGFYLPQVITGRSLLGGIPYGWRVPDCWYWPAGQRGLSDYPERLNVSLSEYMQHPHKSVRLSLQEHAVVEDLEAAQQWEAGR